MTFKDRLKKDRDIYRGLSKQERKLFLWDYYKGPILTTAIALVLTVAALITWAGKKDIAMYAVFLNSCASATETDPAALDDLLAAGGVDMDGKTIDITADLTLGQSYSNDTDGQTIQILAAMFGISGLDVFAADEASFDRYAVQDAFVDLSLFLEPDLYENDFCRPYWYENSDGHRILGGIVLLPGSVLHEAGYYLDSVMIGVAANAENLDAAVTFVTQILQAQLGRK